MSYILEALKKSEQERRRGEVPEINRFDAADETNERKLTLWPIVVAFLVIVNVGVLFVWAPWETETKPGEAPQSMAPQSGEHSGEHAKDQQVSSSDNTRQKPVASDSAARSGADTVKVAPARLPDVKPRQPVKPVPEKTVRQPVAQPEPEIIRPSRQPEPEPEPEPEIIRPRSAPQPQTSYLPQLQELPASLQQRVPDMSFSSHMYSSEPRFRSIIINGRRLKEGQYLNDEIQVREITDKGVILNLDGTDFEVDVLGQWVN